MKVTDEQRAGMASDTREIAGKLNAAVQLCAEAGLQVQIDLDAIRSIRFSSGECPHITIKILKEA